MQPQDLPPGVKPLVEFDKTRFASSEDVFFWVGVTVPRDFVIPREMQRPGQLTITWPDGRDRVRPVNWPMDGPIGSNWRGGGGLGSEPAQIGRYTVSFEYAGRKTPPATFTVEDVPILKDVRSEFVFPSSPTVGSDTSYKFELVVSNRSSETIRFPHRSWKDGVRGNLRKTSGTGWGSSFSISDEALRAAAKIPKGNVRADVFRWDDVTRSPTVELAPGAEYRFPLTLASVLSSGSSPNPPPSGDYDLTIHTTLLVLIGEPTGPWAELCPLHIGVKSTVHVRVPARLPNF